MLVIVAGLIITWTVIQDDDGREPRPIVSDFRSTAFLPVQVLPAPEPEKVEETLEQESSPEIMVPVLPDIAEPTWVNMDRRRCIPSAGSEQVEFAGARVTNARSLVYVIDASGSMMTWLPMVLEAARAVAGSALGESAFRRDLLPGGSCTDGSSATTREGEREQHRSNDGLVGAGRNLIPGGGSNPWPALERAFAMEPDVVFLLSEGLDGTNDSSLRLDELFKRIDRLNPIADPVSGARWTRIQCIEIGAEHANEEDGDLTMRRLGGRYGGTDGWIRLGREELVNQPVGAR